jgi:hypothetical protein
MTYTWLPPTVGGQVFSGKCLHRCGRGDPALREFGAARGSHFLNGRLAMKTERFAGHHEARQALALSVAGVMAITLVATLILLILH